MNDILPLNSENISGLLTLYFVPVSHVATVPVPWQCEVSTAITLQPGKRLFSLAFTRETSGFKSDKETTAAGAVYKTAITGVTPMLKLETTQILTEMSEDLFILIVKDANGKRRLVGNLDEGMRMDYSEDSKQRHGDRAEYTIKFYRDLTEPVPFYTAP